MEAGKKGMGSSVPDTGVDRHFSWFRALGVSLLIIAVGALLLYGALIVLTQQERNVIRQSAALQAEQYIQLQQKIFSEELHKLVRGIYFLARQSNLTRPVETAQEKSALAGRFLSFMKAYDDVDQVRLLGLTGRELVRVNYKGGSPGIVPPDRLQDKSHRYYLKDMQRYFKAVGNPGKVQGYISRLDLNVERGQIEVRLKPTIRLGIAVYDSNGKKIGYLILNYLAETMLEQFRHTSALINGDVRLIDSHAVVLASGERAIPEVQQFARHLVALPDGRTDSGNDTFIVARIDPARELDVIPSLHGVAADPDYFWMIAVRIGEEQIVQALSSYEAFAGQIYFIAVLILILFAIPLGLLLEWRRVHSNHIKSSPSGD